MQGLAPSPRPTAAMSAIPNRLGAWCASGFTALDEAQPADGPHLAAGQHHAHVFALLAVSEGNAPIVEAPQQSQAGHGDTVH